MKRKRIALLFLCTIFFALFAFGSSAQVGRVIDRDGYLSSAGMSEASEALRRAENATGVTFRAYLYDYSRGEYDGDDYRSQYGFSRSSDLCLLIVTYDPFEEQYFYDLYTYGKAASSITDHEVDLLLDSPLVYDKIKGKHGYDLAGGIVGFAEVGTEMILAEHPTFAETLAGKIVIGLVIAAVCAAVGVIIVVVNYKKKLKSAIYPLDKYATLKLTSSSDLFIGKHVSRTRVTSSSGGSSHGGGGGHRGGR